MGAFGKTTGVQNRGSLVPKSSQYFVVERHYSIPECLLVLYVAAEISKLTCMWQET